MSYLVISSLLSTCPFILASKVFQWIQQCFFCTNLCVKYLQPFSLYLFIPGSLYSASEAPLVCKLPRTPFLLFIHITLCFISSVFWSPGILHDYIFCHCPRQYPNFSEENLKRVLNYLKTVNLFSQPPRCFFFFMPMDFILLRH